MRYTLKLSTLLSTWHDHFATAKELCDALQTQVLQGDLVWQQSDDRTGPWGKRRMTIYDGNDIVYFKSLADKLPDRCLLSENFRSELMKKLSKFGMKQ